MYLLKKLYYETEATRISLPASQMRSARHLGGKNVVTKLARKLKFSKLSHLQLGNQKLRTFYYEFQKIWITSGSVRNDCPWDLRHDFQHAFAIYDEILENLKISWNFDFSRIKRQFLKKAQEFRDLIGFKIEYRRKFTVWRRCDLTCQKWFFCQSSGYVHCEGILMDYSYGVTTLKHGHLWPQCLSILLRNYFLFILRIKPRPSCKRV